MYLQRVGTTQQQLLGRFNYQLPLAAGVTYQRSERFVLPAQISGQYVIVVETDASRELYEHGRDDNNTTLDDQTLAITVRPRPDLRVSEIVAPASVDAGSAFSAEFVVVNLGNAATTIPQWKDHVYLSLDDKVTPDDLLIGSFSNESSLESGASYRTVTGSVEVPKRYGGTVYVLVSTDHGNVLDEWPNDTNNTRVQAVEVTPWPFADLVTSGVTAPSQAFEGNPIEVRYTVTNLGSGPTDVGAWREQIWLTTDRTRPHPGAGDLLLGYVRLRGRRPGPQCGLRPAADRHPARLSALRNLVRHALGRSVCAGLGTDRGGLRQPG